MTRHHLELIWVMAKTDFVLRHHGSWLGYVWTVLKPLLLFLVLWFVFTVFMQWDTPYYQLYLLLGILLWDFFAVGTMSGVRALANKSHLLKKVAFPNILAVIASTMTAFLTLFFNLLIFVGFAFFAGIRWGWEALLFFPLLVLLSLLILGVSMFLSALFVRLRDVDQIWEVLIQVGFWLTPIIYPLSIVPEEYLPRLAINPMTGIIQSSRSLLIDGVLPDASFLLWSGGWTLLLLVLGWLVFQKLSPFAAEEL